MASTHIISESPRFFPMYASRFSDMENSGPYCTYTGEISVAPSSTKRYPRPSPVSTCAPCLCTAKPSCASFFASFAADFFACPHITSGALFLNPNLTTSRLSQYLLATLLDLLARRPSKKSAEGSLTNARHASTNLTIFALDIAAARFLLPSMGSIIDMIPVNSLAARPMT